MSEYFQLKDTKLWNVRPGSKVIKAAEYSLLSNANELVDKVKEAAAEAGEQAKAVSPRNPIPRIFSLCDSSENSLETLNSQILSLT